MKSETTKVEFSKSDRLTAWLFGSLERTLSTRGFLGPLGKRRKEGPELGVLVRLSDGPAWIERVVEAKTWASKDVLESVIGSMIERLAEAPAGTEGNVLDDLEALRNDRNGRGSWEAIPR